ncbi:MAG: 4-hydroxybenzoate octaprenyltransferase [Chromatiales bacterium]|nr:4-hydroxybenzoate octaprenyltransferase [Chromatiales bacterium]
MGDRLLQYALLARMHQPIGSLLLLWPTLWALWIAGAGEPDPAVVLVFVVGVFVMRSAGCVMNDFADREIDPHVRRTRTRPIASGKVTPREALAVFAALCLVGLGLVLTLNRLALLYSFAAVALAASYPFMKRWTYLPQVYLGVAFGWGIPMAFAALANEVPPLAWLLLTGVVAWAVAYDTMYAMVDREDDVRVGVKSSAILFGDADRFFVGASQVAVLAVLVLAGRQAGLGAYYATATAAGALLFVYQQYLIRNREPAACFKAFLNNNWVGAVVFAGIVADYHWS